MFCEDPSDIDGKLMRPEWTFENLLNNTAIMTYGIISRAPKKLGKLSENLNVYEYRFVDANSLDLLLNNL